MDNTKGCPDQGANYLHRSFDLVLDMRNFIKHYHIGLHIFVTHLWLSTKTTNWQSVVLIYLGISCLLIPSPFEVICQLRFFHRFDHLCLNSIGLLQHLAD